MNVSEYIFEFYSKKGIDTAFMVTGGQAMYLNDAVGKNKNYTIICTHHEQTATMSADAYARVKNKPAIAVVTAGPGAVNAMNGVVGGYTDSSPFIVISGQAAYSFVEYQNQTGIRQYGIQGINIRPLAEPVTKFFVTVDDPKKITYYLEQAYHIATTGRPGPVWIDVPLDIQGMPIDTDTLEKFSPERHTEKRFSIKNIAEKTIEALKRSKRPLIIAGQGIKLAGAIEEFRKFIEKSKIPVITSRLGIEIIESDHEVYVGRPGNYGERSANFAVQNADLIIAIGSRLSSATVGHDAKSFGKNAYKIVIDIDEKELDKPGVKIDVKGNIDAKDYLLSLLGYEKELNRTEYAEWITICQKWRDKYPVALKEYKNEKPVNSYYFTDRLSDLTPNDASILVDTGSCFHVACQTWKIKKGQSFLTTGGLSSMGYWVAAIGACMANGRKQTICITGDGSLQMNIQEFATIRHNKLPIKVFIFNNNGYLLIRNTQKNFMESRFVGEGPESGVWCPDALKIADAYEIKGIRIDSTDSLDEKIQEVLADEGPVICDIMTPEWQMLAPRVASEKLPDGKLVSRAYEDMFPFLAKEELAASMIHKT